MSVWRPSELPRSDSIYNPTLFTQWISADGIAAAVLEHSLRPQWECKLQWEHDHFMLGNRAKVALYMYKGSRLFILDSTQRKLTDVKSNSNLDIRWG